MMKKVGRREEGRRSKRREKKRKKRSDQLDGNDKVLYLIWGGLTRRALL